MYCALIKIFGEYSYILAYNDANDGYYYTSTKSDIVKFVSRNQAQKFMKMFYKKYPKCEYKIIHINKLLKEI